MRTRTARLAGDQGPSERASERSTTAAPRRRQVVKPKAVATPKAVPTPSLSPAKGNSDANKNRAVEEIVP